MVKRSIMIPGLLLGLVLILSGCASTDMASFAGGAIGAVLDGVEAGINNTEPGNKYQQMFSEAAVQDLLRNQAREAGVGPIPPEWDKPDGRWAKDKLGRFCWTLGEDYISWDAPTKCWKTED